ncbi:MAG: S8 family serine peptidase [Fibrobacter sp.]|nr:S8 family serine peptidase [Fibrobacter sp.]
MNKKLSLIMAAACVGAGVAANYDLLGRQISKSASPVISKTDALKAKQAGEHHVLAKQNEASITPASGRMEQSIGCSRTSAGTRYTRYWFNDEEAWDSGDYLKKVNAYESSYGPRKNFKGSGEAHEKKNYSFIYSVGSGALLNVSGSEYKEKSRLEKNVMTSYRALDLMAPWEGKLSYSATDGDHYYNGFFMTESYKDAVGVYLVDDTAPYNASKDKVLNYCDKGKRSLRQDTQFGALQSSFTLGSFSAKSNIYYYDYECDDVKGKATQFPLKPNDKKIYMGVHTNGLNEIGDGHYNDRAAYLDDYIYETRMIEIVAAGNLAKTPTSDNWNGYTRKTASALNAITVGAVETGTDKVAAYNSWKNPVYASGEKKSFDKPEIYGYTNYFFNRISGYAIKNNNTGKVFEYTPTFDGSETAATYIGGLVGSLLSVEPFYRWHPEVVKALLLTSSDIDVMPKDKNGKIKYHDKQFQYKKDNDKLVLGATDFKKLFAGNHSRYWIANNFGEIKNEKDKKDGKPVLSFKQQLDTFYGTGTYRIAISWLSKSSYAINKGRTPQDFDLFVYDRGGNIIAQSTTGDNPFELVEFKTSDSEVTIKIKLHRDDGERVLLGYNLHSSTNFYQECPVGL